MNGTSPPCPPRWLDRLLEWFCSNEFLEIVQGDLHEMYYRNVQEKGRFKARLCYLGDVVDLFRPFTLGFNFPHFHITSNGMYRNYLTTAFRNFRRQWGFSLINVIGLAIGMAAFMIILTYVSFELSYDDYHQNKNQLFRWSMAYYKSDGELFFNVAASSPAFTQVIRDNMPEVKAVARLYHCPSQSAYITISRVDDEENEKTSFNEENAFFADAAFLTMFDFKMLAGDSTALYEPNTIILSESAAARYFGDVSDDIIGQILQIPYKQGQIEPQYKITGIFRNLPPNTHFQADMLMSYRTLSEQQPDWYEDFWPFVYMYTYIQLHPHVTEQQFRQKKSQYVALTNERYQLEDNTDWNLSIDLNLLRVNEIHLKSEFANEIEPQGNAQTVYFLFIIGILLIIIAWVNYVNLTTAKAVQRAKEVGIRKVAGASREQLILQFISEAFVINLIASLFSLLIIWLSLPFFQQLTGKPLTFHLYLDGLPNMPLFFVVLGSLFIFSTLLSGFYPALVLSSFQPLKTLKGKLLLSSSGGISLRSGLVVVQFTMSVIMIAGTYLLYQQMVYMQNQPLGFDAAQVLIIQSPTDTTLKANALEVFKEELIRQSFVVNAAASSIVPGRQYNWGHGIGRAQDDLNIHFIPVSVDYEFLDAYDFTFLAGRNFSKAYGTDGEAVILNETLAGMLDFENAEAALHQKVWINAMGEKEVIGVVKDYHQSSLKEAYRPICFLMEGTSSGGDGGIHQNYKDKDRAYLSVKISTSDLNQNLEWIEKKYQTYFPGFQFVYFFLDEDFNRQYIADLQFGKIFGVFASLAIFIACLGIFGLSSYMAVQKSKEIGIRKVLGASVTNIVLLLSSKFVRLILISTLIALPLAYFVFDRWLETYAFRISIGWWFFVIPAMVVFLIAIITISVQTVKAALANPVESLKYE